VANLSAEAQKKLLQFLQDHKITRVGGTAPVTLNVRVVVAANVPLATLVEKGAFRADLYYRIDVVSIFLPPLKERKEDVPALAGLFIAEMNRKHGRSVRDLSPAALEKMTAYEWPGNIRELKNAVERAVIFCRGDEIRPEQVQFSDIAGPETAGGRKTHQFVRTDIGEIRRLFKKHGGRAKAVARELNIAPRTLYYQIKRMGFAVEVLRA
jgi:DNA-binding NtrC family response regulator